MPIDACTSTTQAHIVCNLYTRTTCCCVKFNETTLTLSRPWMAGISRINIKFTMVKFSALSFLSYIHCAPSCNNTKSLCVSGMFHIYNAIRHITAIANSLCFLSSSKISELLQLTKSQFFVVFLCRHIPNASAHKLLTLDAN